MLICRYITMRSWHFICIQICWIRYLFRIQIAARCISLILIMISVNILVFLKRNRISFLKITLLNSILYCVLLGISLSWVHAIHFLNRNLSFHLFFLEMKIVRISITIKFNISLVDKIIKMFISEIVNNDVLPWKNFF